MKDPSLKIPFALPGPEPQYPIESVDNALKIILLLRDKSELRQRDVAEYLGVAGSTAHRLLAMLHYRGFLRRDPGGRAYRPGAMLATVAYSIMGDFDPREVLRPVLEMLHSDLSETVHVGTLEGTVVRFIDAIESPRPVRVASRLGQSRPAISTATGKALLAQVSAQDLHRLYPTEEIEGVPAHPVRSRATLEKELEVVRQRGYATSEEDNEDGVSSVAIAIPKQEYPFSLALNVSLPVSRMVETDLKRVTLHLKRAVAWSVDMLR